MAARHLKGSLEDILVPLLQTLSILNGQLASYNLHVDDQEDEDEEVHEPDAEEFNWQPVSFLPQLREMIEGMLESALENWRNLQPAKERPYILDAHLVSRLFEVYGRQRDDLWLYREQLAKWRSEDLAPEQAKEIRRLNGQLDRLSKVLEKILALAEEVKDETIEKVLAKDDAELAIELLFGKRKL
jgi:hypothetical protein